MSEHRHTWQEWLNAIAACGFRCFWCKTPVTERTATKDHLQPQSRGGSDAIENIVPACAKCNARKGIMNEQEFRDLLKKESATFGRLVAGEPGPKPTYVALKAAPKKSGRQYTLWPMCKFCDGTGWDTREPRAWRCVCRKQQPLVFDSWVQREEYQRQQWLKEAPLTAEQQTKAAEFVNKLVAVVGERKAMGTVKPSEDDLAFERRYMG